jgi:hypothetical protein
MKILYTNIHHGNGGGHVTYIISLLRSLRHEHELWLGTPAESRLFRYARGIPGVNVVDMRFTSRPLVLFREVIALRRFLQVVIEMGRAARLYSQQYFALELFCRQTLQVYKNTIAPI